MEIINIKNRPDLVRDMTSGAILNTNQGEYDNYVIRRQRKQEQQRILENQEALINTLKNEVDELKSLVQMLLQKDRSDQKSLGTTE
jgi:uncharacterized protein YlxW (UPF0749 family)